MRERHDASNVSADKLADIREREITARSNWSLGVLLYGLSVFLIYITPLSRVVQTFWRAAIAVNSTAQKAASKIDSAIDYWSPDLASTPKSGEKIAGWIVTSPWGLRRSPVSGASSFHQGVDLADPRGASFTMGRQLYALGEPGTKVEVRCWNDLRGGGLVASLNNVDYLHLQKCVTSPGNTVGVAAGSVIAEVGNSGFSTGAHLHITERDRSGRKIPPTKATIWWALTGDKPASITQKR